MLRREFAGRERHRTPPRRRPPRSPSPRIGRGGRGGGGEPPGARADRLTGPTGEPDPVSGGEGIAAEERGGPAIVGGKGRRLAGRVMADAVAKAVVVVEAHQLA